jgi:hypothetical protein
MVRDGVKPPPDAMIAIDAEIGRLGGFVPRRDSVLVKLRTDAVRIRCSGDAIHVLLATDSADGATGEQTPHVQSQFMEKSALHYTRHSPERSSQSDSRQCLFDTEHFAVLSDVYFAFLELLRLKRERCPSGREA